MARTLVQHINGTEEQILALTPASPFWHELGFYYPTGKTYFYRIEDGVMVRKGDGAELAQALGIKLNGLTFAGVKNLIESGDVLDIPENYEYNVHTLNVDGVVNVDGQINIIS